ENRDQNQAQKKKIAQTLEPPVIPWLGQLAPHFPRSAQIVPVIHHEKHSEEQGYSGQPHGPAMLCYPPERNPFQIAEKKRGIPDWSQAAAHVRDDENEEDNVMRCDAIAVHPNPWADQKHRRAGSAKHVRD